MARIIRPFWPQAVPANQAYRPRSRPYSPPPDDSPATPVVVDDYRLGRGSYFATMAIVNFTGGSNTWSDPLTADWATNTLRGNVLRQGQGWTIYKDAVLARNPSLRVGTLGVNPSDATLASYDIATYIDLFGRSMVQFNYEALEHLLSMFKFVVIQHAVPPITLARIRARSNIGTRFGHWLNYEACNLVQEYTSVRRPLQNAQYANLLVGTRVNANGVTHVDIAGSKVVPGYATGLPTGSIYTNHQLYTDVRMPTLSSDFISALTAFDDLYASDPLMFYFYDNTLSSTYHGEAQLYYPPNSLAIKTAANSPMTGVPNGTEVTPPTINNPNPLSYAQFTSGFATHMDNHNTAMAARWAADYAGVQRMRDRLWGNCYWPVSSPHADYTATRLPIPYFEYFWGQQAAGQTMQPLTTTQTYFQNFGSANRVFVIAQLAQSTDPQRAWLNSTGPGGAYGTWADLYALMIASNATVIVQAARGVTDGWLMWQTGFLPPEGF